MVSSPLLVQLVRYSLAEDLFSYILLIPAISAWLIWQERGDLKFEYVPARGWAIALAAAWAVLMMGSFGLDGGGDDAVANRLSLHTLAWVAGVLAIGFWTLGGRVMRQVAFPAVFLIFMVPLPPLLVWACEVGLQHASAEVSDWFFSWTGATFLRTGLVFTLPNIQIHVAPECSGIRSTLVLFMTSLIAGHLFLDRPWQRVLFAALVIPLGIARNALRIVTIGWLCMEYGPEMIDSPIHHRGGPVFFALSLVPLFALLFFFRRMNRRVKGRWAKVGEMHPPAGLQPSPGWPTKGN